VPTTLDVATQVAAEQALARTSKPAALVAIRPSDGAILAAANSPTTTSFDRALAGHYPPGSTFKIVTSYALLGAGLTANTPVPCPSAVTVGGRRFTNFEGEAAASATFARDFAQSCNTAFIGASRRLGAAALTAAAGQLGIGAQWRLPIAAYSGSVPSPTDSVDRAAEAIGQGRITVSPLAMAVVAAAVVSGRPPTPTLVREPAMSTAPPAAPLPAARLATLRALMRLVVTSGTAASAGLPPGTFGKTGTAEFGGGATPQTHAWFVGWRGDVAFAVVVEGGGVGGRVAAPIAAAFLRRLAPTRVG
jgi:cell division protein FtsI/penicillin-binding protein 2